MKKYRAFALLDVILAVILMCIATIASYSLIKSFRSSSQVQQLTRYATNIAQNFMPFLENGTYDSVLSSSGTGNQLSNEFLLSIAIPAEDIVDASGMACVSGYCYVNSGVYANSKQSILNFMEVPHDSATGAAYFIQGLTATGAETNAITQSLSTIFSVFCVPGADAALGSPSGNCKLLADDQASSVYSVYLVFPKSGSTAPADASGFVALS